MMSTKYAAGLYSDLQCSHSQRSIDPNSRDQSGSVVVSGAPEACAPSSCCPPMTYGLGSNLPL